VNDHWQSIDDAAIVQIEKYLPLRAYEHGGIPIELGVVEVDRDVTTRDLELLAVLERHDVLAAVVRERVYQVRTPEFRDDDCEIARPKTLEEREIEMILVLVTDVEESLLPAVR
jgi:hypothetical protein